MLTNSLQTGRRSQSTWSVAILAALLPMRHEVQITAYSVDDDAEIAPHKPHAISGVLVVYGSSVAQGIGAGRPGMGYSSILGRSLDMEVVNLGFGGAGKAEGQVVERVGQVEACCYLLDLGKSYGLQSADAYLAMLKHLRSVHTGAPLICMTPIFSSKEVGDDYRHLSQHTRAVVRESVEALAATDGSVLLVEGRNCWAWKIRMD
ncbi:MAG: hypothetical protein CME24_14090 [Gemmatimonadetes bacterium]|nr:hypothetical protein [Gemmatimonadota bacterium]